MKVIRRRKTIFAVFTICGILTGALLLAFGEIRAALQAQILLSVVLLAICLSALLWIREYRRWRTARLIADNQILCIRSAVISNEPGGGAKPNDANGIEVFISYFGILLDSKIIKFNQDGIRLKAVEIGHDFISLTYGKEKRVQTTRLLRAAIDREALEGIAEKFRYETGVAPAINI